MRNAVSRRRDSVCRSNSNSSASKTSASGRKRSSSRCPSCSPSYRLSRARCGLAARELLAVDLSVAPHLDLERLREGVDDRHADPVQPAGDLVALAAELAARVQLRQDDGEGRQPLLDHDIDRDARSVVGNGDRIVRMERYFDAVRAVREGLVDGVVDDLVDEVMEASGARRADVHAGAQPDRLETLENGDVFCGVSCLSQRKKPCISPLLGPRSVYQTRRAARRPSRDSRPLSQQLCADSQHRSARPAGLLRSCAGVGSAGGTGRRSGGSRAGSAAVPSKAQPARSILPKGGTEALADVRLEQSELERPRRRARRHVERPVATDTRRPRVSRDRVTHDSGPSLDDLPDRTGRSEPAQLPLQAADRLRELHTASPCLHAALRALPGSDLDEPVRRGGKRAGRRRGEEGTWPPALRRRSARMARRSGSSSESTSSRSSRGLHRPAPRVERPPPATARERQAAARPATRSCAGSRRRQRRRADGGPGRSSRGEGPAEAAAGARSPSAALPRAQLALAQAKLGRDLGKGRREELHDLTPDGDKHRSELRDALCPRLERLLRRLTWPRAVATQRFAAPARRRTRARSHWKQTAERAIEVGTAHRGPPLTTASRSGVNTSTGSRDRSSSAARSGAPLSRALRFANPQRHLDRDRRAAVVALDRDSSSLLAEADQPRIRSCARREALGGDVQALEQVGSPAPFGPTASTTPGSRSSPATHGAVIPERERSDDQPASRIGIRYEKSAVVPWRTAGRADQLQPQLVSSTDSIPSLRNSGLKPMSSASPENGTGSVSWASPTSVSALRRSARPLRTAGAAARCAGP